MSEQNSRLNKADLWTGLVFLVFGLVVFHASWDMPRLENRGVSFYAIPGLVPMALGAGLALCGFLLAVRALRLGAMQKLPAGQDFKALLLDFESVRVLALTALILTYTLILIGWLPYWLATALFVLATIVVFEHVLKDDPIPLKRSLFWAVVQALIVAVVVSLIFERGFLVRLP
ncbi:tripartite tricarboxylate transporter TctB family protein [Natronospirillum operosum]|uniref:Tripartite tricarboxylate transporter TctB family protein n=1 Tax=Natronospirillum operosum TaxID=2759953 RepID=A0A4Z0WGM9_9GAMM|nr:tripartite tricarboxylate transporter TctB family protein [Natronospirillum operosum]TGG93580.1 tripartite tricarboxylate transporter TctB family protein [Natronospirillum operosum]